MPQFEPDFPSLLHGLHASEYHAIDAMSASRLKVLEKGTPAHLTHELANPSDSEDFVLGRALHAWVLERNTFNHEFAICPQVDRRTTEGKRVYADFVSASENKTVLTTAQAEIVEAMGKGVMANADAYLFTHLLAGQSEVSAFANIDGVKAKARFDRIVHLDGEDVIVDVKTTRDRATREEFENSIWRYGYGVQANLYLQMARAVGLNPRHFVFVVVEKKAPYLTAVYRMSDTVVEMFATRVQEAVNLYKRYLATPEAGYDGITEIGVPSWALRKLENTEIGELNNV